MASLRGRMPPRPGILHPRWAVRVVTDARMASLLRRTSLADEDCVSSRVLDPLGAHIYMRRLSAGALRLPAVIEQFAPCGGAGRAAWLLSACDTLPHGMLPA